MTAHQCLNGRAPPYLSEHCIPVSSADTWSWRHLRSANRRLIAVPRFRLNTYGHRAFSVAVPMAWKSGTLCRILSGILRAARTVLGVYLKRTCSRDTSASSVLAVLNDNALYKSTHSLQFLTELHLIGVKHTLLVFGFSDVYLQAATYCEFLKSH